VGESPGDGLRQRLRGAILAGLLGGFLLAVFLGVTLVVLERPAVGAADLLWLLPLLTLAAVVPLSAFFVACAALSTRVGGSSGLGRGSAVLLALAVGVAVLGYLVLVGLRAFEGRGPGLAALYLAASALLAAVVAGLALRVLRPGGAGVPALLAVSVLLAALSGSAFLLHEGPAAAGAGDAVDPFEVRPSADRLLFIGIDGLDGGLVQDFAPRGTVTRLLDGMRGGSTFPLHRDETDGPRQLWHEVLTGLPAGGPAPPRSTREAVPRIAASAASASDASPGEAAWRFVFAERRRAAAPEGTCARRLWEIVALRGTAVSVGWPGSWPARPLGDEAAGLVVSERLLPALLASVSAQGLTWPESRAAGFAAEFEHERAALAGDFAVRFPVPEGSLIRQWLWESYLIDGYRWLLARQAGIVESTGAVFVHFPGLDLLRSRLESHGSDRELLTLLEISEALELYVGWLDALLGDALRVPQGWTAVLVADPGQGSRGGAEGFVVVVGPGVQRGCVAAPIAPLDVAPLLLQLMGFPRAVEMPGRLPEHCLAPGAESDFPVQSYGRRDGCSAGERPVFDAEIIDRLRGLGYLP
jgi:hypothetical protein